MVAASPPPGTSLSPQHTPSASSKSSLPIFPHFPFTSPAPPPLPRTLFPLQGVIADITRRMGAGMAEFIQADEVETIEQYDLYCHYVAGLVGIGLSQLFGEFEGDKGLCRAEGSGQGLGGQGTGPTSCWVGYERGAWHLRFSVHVHVACVRASWSRVMRAQVVRICLFLCLRVASSAVSPPAHLPSVVLPTVG